MELAASISIVGYQQMKEWSKTSREFWSDPKNIQQSRERINVRKRLRKQLKDPGFLKRLEEEFRNKINVSEET